MMNPGPLLKSTRTRLLNAFFPPACPLCRRSTPLPHQLCHRCSPTLPGEPENHCLRCGHQTAGPQQGCGSCLGNRHRADAAYFAYRYEAAIQELIIGFKFGDHSEWAPLLGRLCRDRLEVSLKWESPDVVLPIPLHFFRLIHRRYNQSALLAREVAHFLDRPLVTNGLKRIKMTAPQTRLDLPSRRKNVRGAFRAIRQRVAGRSLLLVDDVYTTGSTMTAAVETLKRAGAERVALLCLARAEPDQRPAATAGNTPKTM